MTDNPKLTLQERMRSPMSIGPGGIVYDATPGEIADALDAMARVIAGLEVENAQLASREAQSRAQIMAEQEACGTQEPPISTGPLEDSYGSIAMEERLHAPKMAPLTSIIRLPTKFGQSHADSIGFFQDEVLPPLIQNKVVCLAVRGILEDGSELSFTMTDDTGKRDHNTRLLGLITELQIELATDLPRAILQPS